jgi:hypothetical protein
MLWSYWARIAGAHPLGEAADHSNFKRRTAPPGAKARPTACVFIAAPTLSTNRIAGQLTSREHRSVSCANSDARDAARWVANNRRQMRLTPFWVAKKPRRHEFGVRGLSGRCADPTCNSVVMT